MSLSAFKAYVESSGVSFDKLDDDKKRRWRETFDRSEAASPGWTSKDVLTVGGKLPAAGIGIGALAYFGSHVFPRGNRKFKTSIIGQSRTILEGSCPYLPRKPFHFPLVADRARILEGEHRMGKTVFLANKCFYEWYPPWWRWLFVSRGFFLIGHQEAASAKLWLSAEIASDEKENPLAVIMEEVQSRFEAQRIRGFLFRSFGSKLPRFLQPQPSLIIIDQAEELLSAYRAEFLLLMFPLVKRCRDNPNALQITFVTNSPEGTKSLEALNGGTLFLSYNCPAPELESVKALETYLQSEAEKKRVARGKASPNALPATFVDVFERVDAHIGYAFDFFSAARENDSPEDFVKRSKISYTKVLGVGNEVTQDELAIKAHREDAVQKKVQAGGQASTDKAQYSANNIGDWMPYDAAKGPKATSNADMRVGAKQDMITQTDNIETGKDRSKGTRGSGLRRQQS